MLNIPDHDPQPAHHQREADLADSERPSTPGWWCSDCHVVHVCSDTCPDTGRRKDG